MSFSSQNALNHRNFNLLLGDQGAAVDPLFKSVILLVHAIGADGDTTTTDSSSHAWPCTTVAPITINALSAEFGSTVIHSANPSALNTAYFEFVMAGLPLIVPPYDFCIEGWFYADSYASVNNQYSSIIGESPASAVAATGGVLTYSQFGTILLQVGVGGVAVQAPAPSLHAWHYVALNLDSVANTFNLYVDGVRVATRTLSGAGSLQRGINNYKLNCTSGNNYVPFNGRIQEFRVTQASRGYIGATCPVPTARFPDQ